MNISAGTILISSPTLEDDHFDKVVVLVTEYNDKGAMGFVINQPFSRTLNQLVEFKQAIPFPIFDGGPVDREHLYFLHRRGDVIDGGMAVGASLWLGGNFAVAVAGINQQILGENDIKILIGYCGWDMGQLEEELAEGSWLIAAVESQVVFSAEADMLWQQLYDAGL